MKITIVIRILLTLILLVLIYHETGTWTAIAFGLIFSGFELNAIVIKRIQKKQVGMELDDIISKALKGVKDEVSTRH